MKKVFDLTWIVLFILLLIVIPLSAQGSADDVSGDTVSLSGPGVEVAESQSLTGGVVSSEGFGLIALILLGIVLLAILGVLVRAISVIGISVPNDTVQEWNQIFKSFAELKMTELRESAPDSLTPLDDLASIGIDYLYPKILKLLEESAISDEQQQQLLEAARKPIPLG